MAILPTNLRNILMNVFRRSDAHPSIDVAAPKPEDAETVFLASLANLPPAERDAQIKRHAWYQALAERQGIAEIEWQTERGKRYRTQTIPAWR